MGGYESDDELAELRLLRAAAERAGDELTVARIDLRIGVDELDRGNAAVTERLLTDALAVLWAVQLLDEAAPCAANLGRAYRDLGKLDDAVLAHSIAGDLYSALEMPGEAAECMLTTARLQFELARYAKAGTTAAEARIAFTAAGAQREIADCDVLLGNVADQVGDFRRAEELYQAAHAVFLALGETLDIAMVEFGLGEIYDDTGRHELAERTLRRAADRFSQLNFTHGLASCTRSLAAVWEHTGRYEQAEVGYEDARRRSSALGDAADVAGCDMGLGNVAMLTGQNERAQQRFESARDAFSALGQRADAANCVVNLGHLHYAARRFPEAERAYRDAQAEFRALAMERVATRLENNLANVYADTGRTIEADHAYAAAAATFAESGHVQWQAHASVNRAITKRQAAGDQPDDATLRDVLDLMIPALIVLDATRTQFHTAAERAQWDTTCRNAFAAVMEAATRLGDAELVSELVETRLNFGPLSSATSPPAPVPTSTGRTTAQVHTGVDQPGAGRLVSGAERRIGLAPKLRMPDGRIALDRHVRQAQDAYHTTVRSDLIVDIT